MLKVLAGTWALFLGIGLLMVGNGMQGTLLGVRGPSEGFSTFQMSLVMSAYFAGFLGGSKVTPELIRRVGHVRVFAALASFISAVLILYPSVTNPWAWMALRAVIGFCFCGVYVTAESWLNAATTAENRGQALSLYMITQMVGIVSAQGLVSFGDPSGFILFIIPSVLVSLSFAPILLSISPTPPFERTKRMSLGRLFKTSPLGFVGMFLTGGLYAAQFGMSAVYATQAGLSVPQTGLFVASIFAGGLLLQYPVGYASDRMDRRVLILGCAVIGAIVAALGAMLPATLYVVLGTGFVIGGMINPLYSLLISYTADYLEADDMSAASGGLLFVNGCGAGIGPIAIGALMTEIGPRGFWVVIALLLALTAAYAAWRMTRRPSPDADEYGAYVQVTPSASAYTLAAGTEWAAEQQEEDAA